METPAWKEADPARGWLSSDHLMLATGHYGAITSQGSERNGEFTIAGSTRFRAKDEPMNASGAEQQLLQIVSGSPVESIAAVSREHLDPSTAWAVVEASHLRPIRVVVIWRSERSTDACQSITEPYGPT
jgi:hypothetical protein